jgi:hypothetical protein
MRRKRARLGVESLEDRIALSGFGEQVSDQAQDPSLVGTSNFGQWQSSVAHEFGGLGHDFNNDHTGSSKILYGGGNNPGTIVNPP